MVYRLIELAGDGYVPTSVVPGKPLRRLFLIEKNQAVNNNAVTGYSSELSHQFSSASRTSSLPSSSNTKRRKERKKERKKVDIVASNCCYSTFRLMSFIESTAVLSLKFRNSYWNMKFNLINKIKNTETTMGPYYDVPQNVPVPRYILKFTAVVPVPW